MDTRTLSGVGVQITAACGFSGGSGNPATFAITGSDFDVSGSYETSNTNSITVSSGSVQSINGGTFVRNDRHQSGNAGFQINTSTDGQVSAHLVITAGRRGGQCRSLPGGQRDHVLRGARRRRADRLISDAGHRRRRYVLPDD